jgi:riboflavin kinase/FMN adenylyltransferase
MPVTRSAVFPARFAGSVVAIGNFDGVHLGHRHLIGQAAAIATAMGAPLGALTFEPHPRTLFSAADARHFRIASAGRKCDLLAEAGVDFAVVEPFTPDLGDRSPEEFVREHLVGRLRVRHVVVGDDYRFGRRRAGDIALLRLLGARLGFGVTALGKVGAGGACVSSTRIRDLLHAGHVGAAGRLLGRSWEVRGRLLPTARRGDRGRVVVHLDDADYVRLPPGSYGVFVRDADGMSGVRRPAVAEVPATADTADFTIALRGSPAHALSGSGGRFDIAFRCTGTARAEPRAATRSAN